MNAEMAIALIDRHQWAIYPQVGGGWVIETSYDGEAVHEIVRTRGALLDAIELADSNQRAGRYLVEN